MHKQIILILLLSYVLPAFAKNDAQSTDRQNDLVMTKQGVESSYLQSQINTGSLDVVSNNDPGVGNFMRVLDAASSKAYVDLIKVMPIWGYVTENSSQQKPDINSAITKFAAMPKMRSSIVLVYDELSKQVLHSKKADVVAPIASITKLMTAMVVLDAKLPLDEEIGLSTLDVNRYKYSPSRIRAGMTSTRGELLKLALMASDNLSAAALARTYPGGTEAALEQMNLKARELGMLATRFVDPTGLLSGNVSTANDLVKMVQAARDYELIQQFTTTPIHTFESAGHRPIRFYNTNPLIRSASWDIGLSKTGYISEAGLCLVMEAKINEQPVIIVLLDSWGRNSRVGDANRVKKWMEKSSLITRNF